MNPGPLANGQRRRGRVAVGTATAGTVLIAALAFWLSFTALTNLAQRSGVAERQAWAWPLIVDGLIVVATVAVVALDRKRAAWYPWLLLMAGTLVSVTANALHATVAADPDVPGPLAGCVAAVPPLVLLASTHLTVVLVRSQRRAPLKEADSAPAMAGDEPGQEVELAAFTTSPEANPEPAPELAADLAGTPALEPGGRRELAAGLRGEGWSNKRIARHLGVAPSTVGRWFAHTGEGPVAPEQQESPDNPASIEREELSA